MATTRSQRTAGIQPPPDLERALNDFLPKLGRLCLLRSTSLIRKAASLALDRQLRRIRQDPTRDNRRSGSSWYLFWVMTGLLKRDLEQDIGALVQLEPSLVQPLDDWSVFASLAAWVLRECGIERVLPQEMPPFTGPQTPSLTPTSSGLSRRRRRALADSYIQQRRTAPTSVPEHNRNDPFARFHNQFCDDLAQVRQANPSPQGFSGRVRARIRTHSAQVIVPLLRSTPLEGKLQATIALQLQLRALSSIWTHRLEFQVEGLFREFLLFAKKELLRQWFSAQNANARTIYLESVSEVLRQDVTYEIWHLTTMGRNIQEVFADIPTDLLSAVNQSVAVTEGTLNDLLACADLAALVVTAKDKRRYWINTTRAALTIPTNDWSWDFLEDHLQLPANTEGAARLVNCLQAAAPSDQLPNLTDLVTANPILFRTILEHSLQSNLSDLGRWSVAIPISNWQLEPDCAHQIENCCNLPALRTAWNTPTLTGNNTTLYVLADGLQGLTPYEAVQSAISKCRAWLSFVWFCDDRRFDIVFSDRAFVRSETTGEVSGQMIRRSSLFHSRKLGSTDLENFVALLDRVKQLEADKPTNGVYRRILRSAENLKLASTTSFVHERYLYLWMALESALTNLDSDIEAVPIDSHVTYRAALLVHPPAWMAGMTYSSARWFMAMELRALYRMRNKTVHEGLVDPPAHEFFLDYYESIVSKVLWTLILNVTRNNMSKVDEILAWCESQHPAASVIPQTT